MKEAGRKRKYRLAGWLASGTLIALAVALLVYDSISERSERVRRVANVRMLVTACIAYSKDRERFPPDLEALVPNYLDDESLLTFGGEGGQPYLYRPLSNDTDYSRQPLIVSPPDKDGRRIVGYVGGHVTEDWTLSPEFLAEFERLE